MPSAFNITESSAKCSQSPTKLAWCPHRSGLRPPRPSGSQKFGYVLRPSRVCRAASVALRARKPKCVRSRLRRHRMGSSQRGLAAACVVLKPPPAQASQPVRGRAACGVTPCPPRLPVLPVRPRKRGLPKGRRSLHAVQAEVSSCTACASVSQVRARQGQALRARVPRGLDPMRQRAHSTL